MAEVEIMPKLGFDMAEGTLVRWVRREGEVVAKGDVLAEIETDKATVEVESGHSGTVRRLLVEAGTAVAVGAPIAVIGAADEMIDLAALVGGAGAVQGEATPGAGPAQPAPVPSPAGEAAEVTGAISTEVSETPRASPLARHLAEERGVDLHSLRGTGPGGRIVRRDVETAPGGESGSAGRGEAARGGREPPGSMPVVRSDQVLAMSRLRQAVGRRMAEAKQQVPHFYVTHEYDMASLVALRSQVNGYLPEQEKLSVNDYLVKAVALCLREYPNLNASLRGDQVIRHAAINVGVAVAVEGGLLTVVVRECDQKSIRTLSAEIRGMALRARQGKVRPTDVEGSTFTISNLGMYDVEAFAAIINPPEAAILAVGSVREVAVAEGGAVRIGQRMKATLSADHRVTDGVEAARFLQSLARYLENPGGLML